MDCSSEPPKNFVKKKCFLGSKLIKLFFFSKIIFRFCHFQGNFVNITKFNGNFDHFEKIFLRNFCKKYFCQCLPILIIIIFSREIFLITRIFSKFLWSRRKIFSKIFTTIFFTMKLLQYQNPKPYII